MLTKSVIVVLNLLVIVNRSLSLSCNCNPWNECGPSPNCSYGVTKGVCSCGCYDTCAKGPGETCDGLWGFSGRCGDGLECKVIHDIHNRDFFRSGICFEQGQIDECKDTWPGTECITRRLLPFSIRNLTETQVCSCEDVVAQGLCTPGNHQNLAYVCEQSCDLCVSIPEPTSTIPDTTITTPEATSTIPDTTITTPEPTSTTPDAMVTTSDVCSDTWPLGGCRYYGWLTPDGEYIGTSICGCSDVVRNDWCTVHHFTEGCKLSCGLCGDWKWTLETNACIIGENNMVLDGISLDDCKVSCKTQSEFACKSLEYHLHSQRCILSEATSISSNYRQPCPYKGGWIYTEAVISLLALGANARVGPSGVVSPDETQVQFTHQDRTRAALTPEENANAAVVGPSGIVNFDGVNVQFDAPEAPTVLLDGPSGQVMSDGTLIQKVVKRSLPLVGPSGMILEDGTQFQFTEAGDLLDQLDSPSSVVRSDGILFGPSGMHFPDGPLVGPSGMLLADGTQVQFDQKDFQSINQSIINTLFKILRYIKN